MSKFTYEVVTVEAGFCASCLELGVKGLADSQDRAVASLRLAIAAKFESDEAPGALHGTFDLVARVEPSGEGRTPIMSRT